MATELKPAATPTTDSKVSSQETDDKVGRKVFIGNLAYTATEDQVREFLKDGGGKLESVALAIRGNGRAAGYAFAVWSTVSEAETAAQILDKRSLNDREIHVAIAKPRSNTPKKQTRKAGPQGEETEPSQKAVDDKVPAADGQHGAATTEETQQGRKQPRSQRKKRSARRLPAEDHDEQEERSAEPEHEANEQKKPKAKRNRKPKSKIAKVDEDTASKATTGRIDDEPVVQDCPANAPEASVSSKKPQSRSPKVSTTGRPSSTLIFVANLPFSVGDEQLGEMFSKLSIEIKSAKVITKPGFRRKGVASAARSKGFGFVETANHEQQTLALQKLQGHKIDDREIVLKVANEREPLDDNLGSAAAPKTDAAQ